MHNLSQLHPGIKLVIQGEKLVDQPFYARNAFIQPDELLENRKKPALSLAQLEESAVKRQAQTTWYQSSLQSVFDEEAAACQFEPGVLDDDVNVNDVAVWMDPIDGSKAFLSGDIENVTNLIGITVKGRPKFGIMHKPFSKSRSNQTRTYVGSVESGLFFMDYSVSD